jgi:hypothetical protein
MGTSFLCTEIQTPVPFDRQRANLPLKAVPGLIR